MEMIAKINLKNASKAQQGYVELFFESDFYCEYMKAFHFKTRPTFPIKFFSNLSPYCPKMLPVFPLKSFPDEKSSTKIRKALA